jgi:hypothetical protein
LNEDSTGQNLCAEVLGEVGATRRSRQAGLRASGAWNVRRFARRRTPGETRPKNAPASFCELASGSMHPPVDDALGVDAFPRRCERRHDALFSKEWQPTTISALLHDALAPYLGARQVSLCARPTCNQPRKTHQRRPLSQRGALYAMGIGAGALPLLMRAAVRAQADDHGRQNSVNGRFC